MTCAARSVAASMLRFGASFVGAFIRPASIAACCTLTLRASVLKYFRAAASTPKAPEPKYTRLR